MTEPKLTFFCELESEGLKELFAQAGLIQQLKLLKASISLGILDLSPERAKVVQRLNRASIPVTAWLLLPKEQGYWFNIDNAAEAMAFYQDFRAWTEDHRLKWECVGLDIEPDIRWMEQISVMNWRTLLGLFVRRMPQAIKSDRLAKAQRVYADLVAQIHADGYLVESYQFPFIADERRARSTWLQRTTGLVDVRADREVWMLYTSQYRPRGVGLLWSFAPEAQAIGLGVTGGGIEPEFLDNRPLTWDELERDLRLAWYWSDYLYLFSLEGCVRQGFLDKLADFAWDQPILFPEEAAQPVNTLRSGLRSALWFVSHLKQILLFGFAGAILMMRLRRRGGR